MSAKKIPDQKTSIKTKVALATLVTITIVLVCVSGSFFFYFHNLLRESIFKQQFVMVSEIAEQLNGRIQLARHQLSLAATEINSNILSDPVQLDQVLTHISSLSMIFDAGLLVIGADGKALAASMELTEVIGTDLSFREYVQKALKNGKPYISEPFRAVTPLQSPLIAIVMPVRNNDDQILCLLVGYHSLGSDQFLTSLSTRGLGSTGYLYLLHNRTVIMHTDSTRILENIAEGKNRGIDKALQGFEGSLENVNSKGQHLLSSFKRIEEANWIVGANIPYDDAFLPLYKLTLNAGLISFGGLLLSLSVVWYVTRRMTQPILQLITHVDAIYSDTSEWKALELKSGDELERLADAFNNMMDNIKRADEALKQTAETHRIVAEFTAEVAFWREPGGRTIFISSNCLELTGYHDTEFYADAELLDKIIHQAYQEQWQVHQHEHDAATGALRQIEFKITRKDGEERWTTHLCHKVYNEKGDLLGIRGNFTDITPIKLLQTEMLYQKAFAEELISKAAVPIFVLDVEHRIMAWNSAMEDLSGLTSQEMLGTTRQWEPFYSHQRPLLADIILSGDYTPLGTLYRSFRVSQHVSGGLQSEGWYDNINGRRSYLIFDAAPIHDRSGRKVAAIETLLDITERRQAEEGHRILSWAVDNNPNSIVITSHDGTIEYVNHKFCHLTGYSTAEAIGQNPKILKSGEMPPEQYTQMWQTISHGSSWHGEFHNKKKSGELYWESASIAPIMNDQGEIIRYLAVKQDITQQKTYENELLQNTTELLLKHNELNSMFLLIKAGKQEWEDTMDSIPEMVLICDPKGAITRCNRAVTAFAARSFDQILGINCIDLLKSCGVQVVRCDDVSGQMTYANGTRHFELLFNELKHTGTNEVRGSVVIIHETTELQRMNDALQKAYSELQQTQAQAIQQEKMASIGQLAAGVAHEINNPMGFISSNLTTMDKYIQKIKDFEDAMLSSLHDCGNHSIIASLDELRRSLKIDYIMNDIHSLLAESQDGAQRVRCIVRDLKSFSHQDETECAPFNINGCLDSTLNMARNEVKYVAEVERDYDQALPLLNCYPQKLSQVFMNLIVNAAHAIEGHGIIRIRTFSEDYNIVVCISDTGKGIPPENLPHIFEPFFTTKEVGKGTGLGLAISYDIIKKHGGSIDVESEVGLGTTFTIRLPIDPENGTRHLKEL